MPHFFYLIGGALADEGAVEPVAQTTNVTYYRFSAPALWWLWSSKWWNR